MKSALSVGVRLFAYTHYDNARGELEQALTRYMPRFGVDRTDIYVVARFHTQLPSDLDRSSPHNNVSEQTARRVERCCKEMGGYLDLALLCDETRDRMKGAMSWMPGVGESARKMRVEDAYRVLVEYRGEKRSVEY